MSGGGAGCGGERVLVQGVLSRGIVSGTLCPVGVWRTFEYVLRDY